MCLCAQEEGFRGTREGGGWGRGSVAIRPAFPQSSASPSLLCLLNPAGMAVFLAMEIVHFSSFVVLSVGRVQGTLAGQSSLTLLSQEMFLAVGTRDSGLMAGPGQETSALVLEWVPL